MRLPRVIALVCVNIALFAVLFCGLELAVRAHRDGVRATVAAWAAGAPPPYSNLGTGR